ncbi:hypothetical protein Fmac_003140 [Flemingia macrophylla]|uniref:Uncharacterized protein n=1 Tax=Flemingia macrophylla TaxID=520843 RepID=A0ABD1NLX7_9FABA
MEIPKTKHRQTRLISKEIIVNKYGQTTPPSNQASILNSKIYKLVGTRVSSNM